MKRFDIYFNGQSREKLKILFPLLLVLMGIALFYTSAARAADPPKTGGSPSEASSQQSDYIIGPEDVLDISVWKNTDLSKSVIVRPDGKISLPLIGDIQAAGLTPNQLRDSIVSKLKGYQDTVVASVIVTEVKSYRIFIIGEVRQPGPYILKTKTTLLQALSMAGGFTQFASKNKIILVRRNPATGSEDKISIRFDSLVYDSRSDKDMILKAGDTIFVP